MICRGTDDGSMRYLVPIDRVRLSRNKLNSKFDLILHCVVPSVAKTPIHVNQKENKVYNYY